VHIYPYKMGSKSASALAAALNVRQIRHEGSKFVGSQGKTVLNWGASELPDQVRRCKVLNSAGAVALAGNKLNTFTRLQQQGVSIPEYTGTQDVAIGWLEKGNCTVVARKVLTGHSGVGIEILEKGLDFVEAPLYTKYIPKDREYRVHVFKGQVIDVQRKVKDPDREVTDWKVRSHGNGFIFVRNDDQGRPYRDLLEQSTRANALLAVQALGLDFGAVDIIWNKRRNTSYVLEVNCAPGLEGQSVEVYANAIKAVA